MKLVPITLAIVGFLAVRCKDAETGQTLMAPPTSICEKCDKKAIEKASSDFFKLTREDITQFLCSFDTSCNWKEFYGETFSTYDHVAFENLIALFDHYFQDYLDILENNKDINIDYLLSLYEKPALQDLPQRLILEKFDQLNKKSAVERKVFKALKRGVKAGDRAIKKKAK